MTSFFQDEPTRLAKEVNFVQSLLDSLLEHVASLNDEIETNTQAHVEDIRQLQQQMTLMNLSLLEANNRQHHAEQNYHYRVDQLIKCKTLLQETELKYYECIVPNFKQNGSFYAQNGSLLAAIAVEHPSIAKMLATSDNTIICSSKTKSADFSLF